MGGRGRFLRACWGEVGDCLGRLRLGEREAGREGPLLLGLFVLNQMLVDIFFFFDWLKGSLIHVRGGMPGAPFGPPGGGNPNGGGGSWPGRPGVPY